MGSLEFERVLVIVGAAILALLLFNYDKSAINCISYVPSPETVLPAQWVGGLSLMMVLIGLAKFMVSKDFKIIALFILLAVAASQINPILNFIMQVDNTQYEKLNALIGKRDDMVRILPNYTNAKCQMTYKNYEKMSALALDPKAPDIIKNLPIYMPIDQVKEMCKKTVFVK